MAVLSTIWDCPVATAPAFAEVEEAVVAQAIRIIATVTTTALATPTTTAAVVHEYELPIQLYD